MRLEEAIKEIELGISYAHFSYPSRQADALKLGIEAAKQFLLCRKQPCCIAKFLLPGETKDRERR